MISPRSRSIPLLILLGIAAVIVRGEVPVLVKPVNAKHTMVVAGHPEAAAAGDAIFREGGNAIDAAVAVSLALGVAEPYGSGLGGKLMLLYFDAKSGNTYAVDAMDEASRSLVPSDYRKKPEKSRYDGWSAVCTPGLAAGLHAAHARWGKLPWQQIIQPAITLADSGFTVLPKTRLLFEERLDKLRGGDGTLATIFLPKGELPDIGSRLPNHELARTMELLARNGTSGFYRGPVADALVEASRKGGGQLTHDDLENYEARMSAPIAIDFEGYRILGGPPPSTGSSLFMTILKGLESESLKPPLRTAANIDLVGRFWREAHAMVQQEIGDSPKSRAAFDHMV
ncbi:MAG TPA: gamma-glutamyltransferase, partial [Opitutaceae bacterium]|nr:gamma-glutamyltransferase [Opitutaceae bacterium]